MKQSLRRLSFERFKQNVGSYIAIGLMCGLFLVLAAMLSLVNELLILVVMPAICMPMIFSCYIACYYMKANQPVTISAMTHYYFGFFNPKYRGSFRGIRAFLISLAFYAATSLIVFVIFYSIFKSTYGATFTSSLSSLVRDYMSNEFTYDDLVNYLSANNNLLLTFVLYVYSLSLPVGILFFIYSISFSSLSIYYRDRVMTGAPSLLRLAIGSAYSICAKKMRKEWFKLNWPLLTLSLVGSALGAVLSIYIIKNISYLFAFISLGSVALLFFYLPFYFPSMEILFEHFEYAFLEGNKKAVEMIISRIQNSIDLTDEEKRSLEESFKNDKGDEE